MENRKLTALRSEIDRIDSELIKLFDERMSLAIMIGEHKLRNNLAIENCERESMVIQKSIQSSSFPAAAATLMRTVIDSSKRLQRKSLNVYLIGMPGCGKTCIGRQLAKLMNRSFIDTDEMLMHQLSLSIDGIFDLCGEEGFRLHEHIALKKAACTGNCVIATGGGAITYKPNLPLIKNTGFVVYIELPLEELLITPSTNRPLLREGDESIRRLYSQRKDIYRSCADFVYNPNDAALAVIANEFADFVENNAPADR